MKTVVFRVVAPYSPSTVYQRFGGTYCLHLQDDSALKMEAVCLSEVKCLKIKSSVPPKSWYPKEDHTTL
jgi:hypothetical protein